jgi:S-adenosylmethionine hydrolase
VELKLLTLTTDMGMEDYYVASIKGYLLSKLPELKIIDITHSVAPFDVVDAAYHLRSCYQDFPKGTIHIVGVDSEPVINFGNSAGSFPSILQFADQFFISNDNGFFGAFLGENQPDGFYRIDHVLSNPKLFSSPTKNILCQTAVDLLNGSQLEDLASPYEHYMNALTLAPVAEQNLLKGHIIHIDSYGNAITNISKSLFERYGEDVSFTIYFRSKNYYIDRISKSYNEVPQGEKVAIFNENDLLEIAINRAASNGTGGANKLFGLSKGDMVRIEFTSQGSHRTLEELF